jgi:hypothetical protein
MFQIRLWKQGKIYIQVLQLVTELIALPPSDILIKFYDFKGPMKSFGYSASLDLRQFL